MYKLYDDNIIFNRFEKTGKRFIVTLRVKDSKGKDHRLGYTGRHLINLCWHGHGHFFDELIKINPNAEIKALGRIINKSGGNWQDIDVGSILYPAYMSELCDC